MNLSMKIIIWGKNCMTSFVFTTFFAFELSKINVSYLSAEKAFSLVCSGLPIIPTVVCMYIVL